MTNPNGDKTLAELLRGPTLIVPLTADREVIAAAVVATLEAPESAPELSNEAPEADLPAKE